MADEIEKFGEDLARNNSVNICAEKVKDGYAISMARMGDTRQHYVTLPAAEAKAFLTGVTCGLVMAEAEGLSRMDNPLAEAEDQPELPDFILEAVANQMRCPDCLSTVTKPVMTNWGAWRVDIIHDVTCPLAAKYGQ